MSSSGQETFSFGNSPPPAAPVEALSSAGGLSDGAERAITEVEVVSVATPPISRAASPTPSAVPVAGSSSGPAVDPISLTGPSNNNIYILEVKVIEQVLPSEHQVMRTLLRRIRINLGFLMVGTVRGLWVQLVP